MLNKRIIFLLAIGLLIASNCYAIRLPTKEELEKYCIAVKLKVDNDIHYFSYQSVKELSDENGLIVRFGKDLSKESKIPKEEILN